jgi:large subunit ribosomal protein L21
MYALVEIKGKQYKVGNDAVITVDRIESEEGAQIEFDSVVLVRTDKGVKIGQPYVKGITVKADVESHGRHPKVVVFKHKRRKNYRRTRGHRQGFSTLRVKEITGVS